MAALLRTAVDSRHCVTLGHDAMWAAVNLLPESTTAMTGAVLGRDVMKSGGNLLQMLYSVH